MCKGSSEDNYSDINVWFLDVAFKLFWLVLHLSLDYWEIEFTYPDVST